MNNFKFKTKKYVLPTKNKITIRRGIVYFCGKPASYIAYQNGTFKKLPTIDNARTSINNVGRCADSFRPDPRKYIDKTKVYRCKLVFRKGTDKLIAIDIDGKIYFYSPNISLS